MDKMYDTSWDTDPNADDAFDRKYEEWERRDWIKWLNEQLTFPFQVKRFEDMTENPFNPGTGPFSVGQLMQATALEKHTEYEVALKVANGKRKGLVPLADVEVINEENPNYWPVREYVVWAANH